MIMTPVFGVLALAMQPALPAAGLDCARAAVNAAEREAMADALARGAEPFPDEVGLRLRACGEQAGHDDETGPAFVTVALVTLLGDALRGRLAAGGIAPAIVDSWYAAQDEATRVEYPDQAASERMVMALNAAGVPMEALDAHGRLLGHYLATLMIPA